MPFDVQTTALSLVASAVYRPGQEEVPLDLQVPAAAVELGYKAVSKAIGRKGLRYKDEATLLSLMVTHKLFAALPARDAALDDATAVIVSSNFNNIDTVVQNARIIEAEHVDATSAMALPNASSNSVSATLSIVHQLRGPNLMLCNGEESGLDGFFLGRQLLAAGRARQVLLIGVEVTNPEVEALFGAVENRFHGAAAVLFGQVGEGMALRPAAPETAGFGRAETEARSGAASGAEGVLRLALAAERARAADVARFEAGSQRWELVGE